MKNDGGPAFPVECDFSDGGIPHGVQTGNHSGWVTGMSLRDRFATDALRGLLAIVRNGQPGVWYDAPADKNQTPPDDRAFVPDGNAALWANAAYRIADAMLAERAK